MKMRIYVILMTCFFIAAEGVGQDYSFRVKYGMIYAGHAKLSYQVENEILTGELNIYSSPWLSNLWTLSDSIRSVYDIEAGRLQNHTKAIHEGSFHRNYEVVFGDSGRVEINGKNKLIKAQGLRDVPSLLYELSHTQLKHGDTLHYPLWDGRGYGILSLVVEKASGPSLFKPFSIEGWHLIPLSSSRKSRENRIQLSLLLSKALPHIPVKIEIDTKYGDVVMRLAED